MKISLKNLVGLHEEEVKDSDIPFLVKPDEDEEKNKLKQPVVPDVPSLVDVVGKIATDLNTPATPATTPTPTQKPATPAATPAATSTTNDPYNTPAIQQLRKRQEDAIARFNAPVQPEKTVQPVQSVQSVPSTHADT